jgi:hypothetical protein
VAVWGRTGETDYAPNSATDRVMRLCKVLIDRFHPLRTPMPLLALRAAAEPHHPRADDEVRKGVEFLREMHLRRGLRCRVVGAPQDGDDFHRGLAVLRDLAGKPWESRHRPHLETYVFPRSGLLQAVEQAVAADDEYGVVVRLERMRWRPRPPGGTSDGWAQQALRAVSSPANLVGALAVAVLGALAPTWGVLVPGVLAALLLVVVGSAWARHHEGLLPWHGPAGRWLSTTTFLATARNSAPVWSLWRPRQSRETRAARANEVAEIFRLADTGPEGPERERARQFYLELRTLALLDDLRHNFRPRPLLRVRRHVLPPVVFVPRAGRDNGGITLLRVISDVRSRRSELDPLLVIAGLTQADEEQLHMRTVVAPTPGDPDAEPDPTALYFAWVRDHLRVGQSPSVSASLPWVLPIRLPVTLLTGTGTVAHDASPLGPPNWVRNAPRLLAGLVVLAMVTGAGVIVHRQPRNCHPHWLHVFDSDTVQLDSGECYGISDGSVVFQPEHGVRLNGSGRGLGDKVDLSDLMRRIKDENADARQEPRHVVLFYVGEVTAAPRGTAATALNGLRELAGVHAQQKAINARNGSGRGNVPKVVVEVANGGLVMDRQKETVDRIVGYKREHPNEVMGVVGLSRDRDTTEAAVKELQKAGLSVVAPQNSDDRLDTYPNYFSLAATNKEEARVFQEAIESKKVEAGKVAVILKPPGHQDIYSEQQAADAREALRAAHLTVHQWSATDVDGALDRWKPSTLYFTGRAEGLNDLARALRFSNHRPEKLALLTGDDLTKTLATEGREQLPGDVTLYYASLAAPQHTFKASNTLLPADIDRALGLEKRPEDKDPLFEDGTMALAYDAAGILYDAAQDAEFRPEFVNGTLLTMDRKGASGQIDLNPARRQRHCGHTVAVFKAWKDTTGVSHTTEVVYRGPDDGSPAAAPPVACPTAG